MLPLATPTHGPSHQAQQSMCLPYKAVTERARISPTNKRKGGHAPACSQLCVIRCLKPPFFMDGSKSSWKFKMNMITTPSSFFTGTTSTKHGLHVPERPRDTDRRERE